MDFSINFRHDGEQAVGHAIDGLTAKLNHVGVAASLAFANAVGFSAVVAIDRVIAYAKDRIEKLMEFSRQIHVFAGRTGLDVEEMQALKLAADRFGASVEDIAMAFRHLAVAKVTALQGNRDDLASFLRFGVSSEELRSRTTEQLFRQIADHLKTSAGGAQELDDAINVLGRDAQNLMPVFKQGLFQAADEMKRLGLVLGKDVVENVHKLSEALSFLGKKMEVMIASLEVKMAEKAAPYWRTALQVGGKVAATGLGAVMGGNGALAELFGVLAARATGAGQAGIEDLIKQFNAYRATGDVTPGGGDIGVAAGNKSTAAFKPPSVDALQKIGLFVGGGPNNPMVALARSQYTLLMRIDARLSDMQYQVVKLTG